MDTQPQQLLNAALALSETDRASLAAVLIRSLDAAADPAADSAWASEIERRIRSIDDGSAELESWDSVMDKMRDRRDA
ncbi:MAG: putative addiction module component (TIGR02574 family) [Pirellulaceae bacterium]|jgi:putative addiction module component (TIGR02574 family)